MTDPPLSRRAHVEDPDLVGAEWWQESLDNPVGRRQTLQLLLAAGVGAIPFVLAVRSCGPDTHTERRSAIDMQKTYGWSFGAAQESLEFDPATIEAWDPAKLNSLAGDLMPTADAHRPYYAPTLFEAPAAHATTTAPGDPATIPSLATVLRPILTPAMTKAFESGKAFADSLADDDKAATAAMVDLDGPESVAFAAGAAGTFDPVFIFDNWPHPRGVVRSHLTLAAAAHYHALFVEAAQARRASAPPLFVLDRQRLASYQDELDKFDNRYSARIPSADALRVRLGVARLFYVSPSIVETPELDDLNETLVDISTANISVLRVGLPSLDPVTMSTATIGFARPYTPTLRRTAFSGSPRPGFGTVPVVLTEEAVLLGVMWSRSGTWSRSSGSSWGG